MNSTDTHSAGDSEFDIYIVGLGISNVDHVTRQTERTLRSCNEVLYLDAGIGVREYLESVCPLVTDLISESYAEDEKLIEAYYDISARVVDSAMARAPVAFALYGHPTTFALPPTLIKEAAKLLDLSVKALPGISALDCICADLMIDPLCYGLQSFEATDLIARKHELNPELPSMIWQIGTIESSFFSSRPSKSHRFDRLQTYLSNVYGEDHVAYAIFSSTYAMLESQIIEFRLGDMRSHAAEFHGGHTLYVPPKYERIQIDEKIVGNAENFEYVEGLTE